MVACAAPIKAFAATTASIAGFVVDVDGHPIAGVAVSVTAPSGNYAVRSDASGRFVALGIVPDSYQVTFSADGYETLVQKGVVVLPGSHLSLSARLQPLVKTLAKEIVRTSRLGITQTTNEYVVVGTEASAKRGVSPSGLSSYVRGTIQGAVGSTPGFSADPFGDAIVRGGKADEALFTYEDVPMPQAEVAEPGGNPISASLPTTGVAYTTVSSGAFSVADQNVLSGVVDQVASVGAYPGKSTITFGSGLLGRASDVDSSMAWADPNLRVRTFLATRVFNDAIEYGDRRTFYPAEVGTYGLGLQSQGGWSALGNEHVRLKNGDDVQLFTMGGQAAYDLYATPYSGETYGSFGPYPGARDLGAQVSAPSRVRGVFDIEKLQLTRARANSLVRLHAYRSHSGSSVFGPWWDDLSFPSGPISLASTTSFEILGLAMDIDNQAAASHELRYGSVVDRRFFAQHETVPIVPEVLTSNPVVSTYGLYAADSWSPNRRVKVEAGVRFSGGHARRSDGSIDTFSGFDPRGGISWRVSPADDVVRLWAGKYTQFPSPLEIERNVTIANQPPLTFLPLHPQLAGDYEVSFGHNGRLAYKITAFVRKESNLIDVIPTNFRAPGVVSGTAGTSLGVALPQNIGEARMNGLELGVTSNNFTMNATYTRGFSTSASPFGLNNLNAPATAAGHLFPLSFVAPLQATASYEIKTARFQITPALSFESGYPYGNGKTVFIYCGQVTYECPSANGAPRQVLNDNNLNPGTNYYFLRDPSKPYCPLNVGCNGGTTYNPLIGSLQTPEGNDPFTLRSAPALLLSLHMAATLTAHLSVAFDVTNLLDHIAPIQHSTNPWLIGPPGYGGSPNCATPYAQWYGGASGINSGCYTLGNGVPTMNGQTRAMPWTYGTDGYIPVSYPAPRTIYLRLSWSAQ